MKRHKINEYMEVEDKRADSFINDLIEVYIKHSMSLTQEDCQGTFIIDKLTDDNIKWLENAMIGY